MNSIDHYNVDPAVETTLCGWTGDRGSGLAKVESHGIFFLFSLINMLLCKLCPVVCITTL